MSGTFSQASFVTYTPADSGHSLIQVKYQVRCQISELGLFLWQRLITPTTLPQLIEHVLTEYNVPVAVAQSSTINFLEELHEMSSFGGQEIRLLLF